MSDSPSTRLTSRRGLRPRSRRASVRGAGVPADFSHRKIRARQQNARIMKQIINKPGRYCFTLDEKGRELEIVGRFHLTGNQVGRWDIEIIHAVPNTTSKTNIKGVVDGSAQAFVNGTIKVLPAAKNTEAFLEERILLVSPEAKAEAVPNLEIETDQVHCSHAATVGKIDDEEIFYLQSRGIPANSAKKIICSGFLEV